MNRYILLLGFVIASFLAVGMFQAKSGAGESGDEIRRLEAEIKSLKADIGVLDTEFETLTRPDRIAELASSRLGMRPARSNQMLEVNKADAYFGPLIERGDDQ
jgi:cell division protein FtsL